ncbi:BREX-1 system phosphatase PglZ type A [Oceanihabitans sp. IOP_32]|uniref:BREX-1 system phosphatase PglZ type A n=1 Tax=Oceanihabitans sp. IOP_32 TaxID=2529032 RepID=UPI0012939D6C|nr:BREX-1 system phosphatase PglZ type A [Oceanihabitans sp. IOP_32]QFZ53332.1 BREX-1 system phosphatase PglZ type A [Oceanihabitans sp. IOP_32]
MSQKIQEALEHKFKSHDVIFWYDENSELKEDFENLVFNSIEKVHVNGNEFEVKHRVTTKKAEEKYLLYFNTKKPKNNENWLLDLELAYHQFHTDQEAIILQELGLDFNFKTLVAKHLLFFKSKERLDNLKSLLGDGDSHNDIRYKMLAVVFNTEHVNLNTFIHAHGTAFANGNEKMDRDLERYNLVDFYWNEINDKFKYQNKAPKIYDFLIEAFSNSAITTETSKLSKESKLLLSLWKDTITYRTGFNTISEKIAEDLNIEDQLNTINLETILEEDLFKLIDKKIIHELVHRLIDESISNESIQTSIKSRENKFWYTTFEPYYQCIAFASQLQDKIKTTQSIFKSITDGLQNYTNTYYEIDYLYRKFILWYRKSNHDSILGRLANTIEKLYTNTWLLKSNNQWQKVVNNVNTWPINESYAQRQFYKQHVKPFVDKNQRVFVIISDALRYECGAELNNLLVKENRYDASIQGLVASIPSYTQLGMASLLPNTDIKIDEGSDAVSVDGMSASGVIGRAKILQQNSEARATAIKADDFMQLNANTDGREFVKQYDVIYIYHNRIDKTGDDKTTEDKVFDAVEDELDFFMEMLKKISNMNGNNMLITSDHGFLYQYQNIDESDYIKLEVKGDVVKYNRRFVLGNDITANDTVKQFTQKQLGLSSTGDVLIPKSVNRLRVKGAGSKFVHGGASLQEIIIPVIKVNKKRQDTTTFVDIDIIKSTDKITTNLLPVSFIQMTAVNKNSLGRTIRAAIFAEDNTMLSDQYKYVFDSEDENQRQREVKHRFQLTALASGKYKNQRVKLVLEEPMDRSNKWKVYKEYYYTLNISFTTDFDGF